MGYPNLLALNKPRLIFIFLSIYIVVAFSWWTFAHYRSSRTIYEKEKERVELLCYKATLDVNGEGDTFNDSNDVKRYFYKNYPELEIVFDEQNPLATFLIRPSEKTYADISRVYYRKTTQYLLEGFVIMVLLFWGIIWIYRSFRKSIELKRQQSNFLLSITHELKTPLTSLKLYIETLIKRNLAQEQIHTILQNAGGDVIRLRDLVENLLLSAQLESKKYELITEPTNMSEFLNNTIARYVEPRKFQERFILDIQPDVHAKIDRTAIEMVLHNLFNNAVKYSPPEGRIFVSLHEVPHHVLLNIADEGPGIGEAERAEIFNKFYRIGDENTRKTKGTGLGLFIVKNLLGLHHADIEAKANVPKGTIFAIRFNK